VGYVESLTIRLISQHSLPSFLNLHRVLKKRGLNPDNVDWFVNALETGTVYVSILTLIGIQLQNM